MWLDWDASIFSILLDSSLRTLAVVALTAIIVLAARIRASSVQHGVWTVVLVGSLFMPFLSWIVPPLFLAESAPAVVVSQSAIQHPFSIWPTLLLMSYAAGLTGLLLREALGWFAMTRLARSSQPIDSHVYESSSIFTPIACGVFRTRIVLPADWKEWTPEKLRAVLVHENAHRTRRDPLIGFLARINRAVFWFHPIAWWLERKLAATAERACDDEVVAQLGGREHYARVLIEIAEAVQGRGQRAFWQGVGMAEKGMLSQRIDRLLKGDVGHRISFRRKALVSFLCLGVVYLAAACRQETGAGTGAEILIKDKGAPDVIGFYSAALPIKEMTKDLLAVPGVQSAAPILTAVGTGFTVVYGIDPESFNAVSGGFKVVQGKVFEKPNEALIDEWQQRKMKVKVGDRIQFLKTDFTIAGVVKQGKGARVFIPLQTMQKTLKREGLASLFQVKLESGVTTKQGIDRIRVVLADDSKEILALWVNRR